MAYRWKLDRLRELIDRRSIEWGRDITYEEIAVATGLAWNTIQRIVSKDITNPRVKTMSKIADYLQVDVAYFTDLGDDAPATRAPSPIDELEVLAV